MTRLGTILSPMTLPTPKKRFGGVRYALTPSGESMLNAANAEAALSEGSDVYDVTLAFDAALVAADPAAVLRFLERFPHFAEEIVAVGYARFAFGMTLSDSVSDAEPPEVNNEAALCECGEPICLGTCYGANSQ